MGFWPGRFDLNQTNGTLARGGACRDWARSVIGRVAAISPQLDTSRHGADIVSMRLRPRHVSLIGSARADPGRAPSHGGSLAARRRPNKSEL